MCFIVYALCSTVEPGSPIKARSLIQAGGKVTCANRSREVTEAGRLLLILRYCQLERYFPSNCEINVGKNDLQPDEVQVQTLYKRAVA